MNVCVKCRRVEPSSADDKCVKCGNTVLRAPYRWSPPKHTNKTAWKRIAKGEWLWDRRRVRRNPSRQPATFFRTYTHKKGQRVWGQWAVPRKKGADVDLGG